MTTYTVPDTRRAIFPIFVFTGAETKPAFLSLATLYTVAGRALHTQRKRKKTVALQTGKNVIIKAWFQRNTGPFSKV